MGGGDGYDHVIETCDNAHSTGQFRILPFTKTFLQPGAMAQVFMPFAIMPKRLLFASFLLLSAT